MIDLLLSATANPTDWSQHFVDTANALGMTPGSLAEDIQTAAVEFSGRMIPIATGLLSLTVAIRVMMIVIKEILDGDIVELFGEVFFTLLMGMFLLILLQGWASGIDDDGSSGMFSVPGYAKQLMGVVLSAASGGSGGTITEGIGGLFAPVMKSGMDVIGAIWAIIETSYAELQKSLDGIGQVESWKDLLPLAFMGQVTSSLAIFQSFVMNIILGFIAMLAVMIAFAVLMYHMLSGFITLQIVFAFGPFTLAAYPLIDTWAKKALSSIAGAIIQMAAAIFLMAILKTVLERAVAYMTMVVAA